LKGKSLIKKEEDRLTTEKGGSEMLSLIRKSLE
jgi:hypothetical protein